MKLLLAALLITALPVYAGPPVYRSLKTTRSLIKIPEYSLEQKKLVLEQARLILEQIYVHQAIKTKDYGDVANPTPALNKIESQIANLSTENFHRQLSDIFYRLRDLHTLYFLPKPFACYQSFLPFELEEVTATNGKKVIAVSDVGDDPDVLKNMPKPFNIKVGDVITKIDGLNIEEAIKNRLPRSLGANPSASRRNAIKDLKFIQHNLEFLPKKDSAQLEFVNAQGKNYKTEIPWMTWTDWNCVAESQTPEYLTAPAFRVKSFDHKIKIKPSKTKGSSVAKIDEGHTDEPVLYWHINRSVYGNFGYIELSSFTPDVFTIEEVIAKVKEILLQDVMKNTDGLMIEMRANTGGQLPLAERLIQFFSPKELEPEKFYLKTSPANLFYMNTILSADPFTTAINSADAQGKAFTAMLPITPKERLNDLGQIYFKPIAVFTSSTCYSACETFSSLMQDNKLGTIFGEDSTTGGGGANTFGLNQLLADFNRGADTGPFKKLPYGQDITFAWRESVRGGLNVGKHIEDAGVKSDRISAPAMSDLFNSTNDQLLVLQKFLKEESPKYTSNIYFANEDRHDFEVGSRPEFYASWNNTNSFIFKMDGKIIESRNANPVSQNALVEYPAVVTTAKVTQGRLEMQGLNDNTPVWRKVLNYRVIPKSKKLASNESWQINLNRAGDIATYTINTPAKDGWNISANSLHLGDGTSYGNDSTAEASLFVTLPSENYELHFDAAIETETTDTFQLVAISEGVTTVLIDKLSGNIPLTHYKVDLNQFAQKAVELRFVFKSDPELTYKGITITNLIVRPNQM